MMVSMNDFPRRQGEDDDTARFQRAIDYIAMCDALNEIWKICHRPSTDHPKGRHAYTHFMADFDEIRKLCKPFVR